MACISRTGEINSTMGATVRSGVGPREDWSIRSLVHSARARGRDAKLSRKDADLTQIPWDAYPLKVSYPNV